MPAYAFASRSFVGGGMRHSSYYRSKPMCLDDSMVYVRAPQRVRGHWPEDKLKEFCQDRAIDLVIIYGSLVRVDHNVELHDAGYLLQFATPTDALLFKLSWNE